MTAAAQAVVIFGVRPSLRVIRLGATRCDSKRNIAGQATQARTQTLAEARDHHEQECPDKQQSGYGFASLAHSRIE